MNAEAFHADKLSTNFERGCGLSGTAVWCWRDDYPGTTHTTDHAPVRVARHRRELLVRVCPRCRGNGVSATARSGARPTGILQSSRATTIEEPDRRHPLLLWFALADDTPWCWEAFGMVPVHVSPSPALSRAEYGWSLFLRP